MTLMEELKERWKAIFLERESVEKRADELAENMQELEVALAALQSLHNPIADEQPELFDEPQEIEASVQSEPFVSLAAETEMPSVPGAAEESRDQLCSVEGCEIHADDASEFAEEGYAPVIDPEPSPLMDAQTCEPVLAYPQPETLADPIWNEPAPTKPEADAIAKAVDWYDPKAVAERNRFDPFRMFRRETEDA